MTEQPAQQPQPAPHDSPAQPTLVQRVAEILAEHGLTHVFGVVGSGNFHLTNQLIAAGIEFTAARHEGAAASMADAYTRLASLDSPETRQVRPELNPTGFAAVSVHQGCGLTNTLTGLTEAAKSGTGMLVLTAETPQESVGSNFEIDQFSLVEAVGATPLRISDPNEVATVLDEVFQHLARRHTVVLNLPIDLQTQPVTAERQVPHRGPRTGTIPQLSQVTRAAKSLFHAQRPVVLAGRGALHARTEIIALAETAGALLTTSAVANGLFEGHPWNLGISGGFSSPVTAELISQADLVLSFGCALNDWTTRHGELINDEATLIQVDHSPWAIGKFREVSQTLVADSAAVAEAVNAELTRLHHDAAEHFETPSVTGYRTDHVRTKLSAKYFNEVPLAGGDLSTEDRIDPRVLSTKLNRLLPEQRVVTTDSGNFMGYPVAYLRVPDVRGFCFTQAFQSIGLGLGTLVGAAFAEPTRMPVLGTGDGGFAMGISELETLVRLRIPAVVIIYNDAAYGAELHHFGLQPGQDTARNAVTFPDTDFARIAIGYGARGITVRVAEDLSQVTDWLETAVSADEHGRLTGTPLIVDAKIASDGGAWWLEQALRHEVRPCVSWEDVEH
ncbi:thiamine pyrophosphate-binding protein [Auritidibacter ignavus]|uniref:thiamine pyrophosphate-binding protein n=1 Tax=Auritidibacter ignavus TaxID=678932 RepID=UPI0024BABFF7|nr:thiamine pyrophosphate-binding protein [Auritidibacter ignavus]WHS34120.1 thiamine pyrophosphate-binding protein [Auritidibacter ignavus]